MCSLYCACHPLSPFYNVLSWVVPSTSLSRRNQVLKRRSVQLRHLQMHEKHTGSLPPPRWCLLCIGVWSGGIYLFQVGWCNFYIVATIANKHKWSHRGADSQPPRAFLLVWLPWQPACHSNVCARVFLCVCVCVESWDQKSTSWVPIKRNKAISRARILRSARLHWPHGWHGLQSQQNVGDSRFTRQWKYTR